MLHFHCILFFSLHWKHHLFSLNSWETCSEKLWNLTVHCLVLVFQPHQLLLRRSPPSDHQLSRADQPGAWGMWTSSLSWTNAKEHRVCAVWYLESALLMRPCWETYSSGLHRCFFLLSHWHSGKYLVSCNSVVWAFSIPTGIEQSYLPRLDHQESAIFECHPKMVPVGKRTVKKQDIQGCSPVVHTPVAEKRQVQTEQNFNCLSKRHHCNICFKSQGNKCQLQTLACFLSNYCLVMCCI